MVVRKKGEVQREHVEGLLQVVQFATQGSHRPDAALAKVPEGQDALVTQLLVPGMA